MAPRNETGVRTGGTTQLGSPVKPWKPAIT